MRLASLDADIGLRAELSLPPRQRANPEGAQEALLQALHQDAQNHQPEGLHEERGQLALEGGAPPRRQGLLGGGGGGLLANERQGSVSGERAKLASLVTEKYQSPCEIYYLWLHPLLN